jgi:hypothetical protein
MRNLSELVIGPKFPFVGALPDARRYIPPRPEAVKRIGVGIILRVRLSGKRKVAHALEVFQPVRDLLVGLLSV